MALSAPVGLLYWYTTSVILGLLTLINLFNHTYRYITRPTSRPFLPASLSSLPIAYEKPSTATSTEVPRSVKKFGLAALVAWEKYVVLTSLPLPAVKVRWWIKSRAKASSLPTTELTWGMSYTLGCFVLCFYGTSWDARSVANQAGWLAVAQVPLIVALAGKNNLVSCLTGISYERLNFLHRAAGRVCLATVWIHAVGYWYINTGYTPGAWKLGYVRWGITGLMAFSCLYLCSISIVRRRLYEFFLVTHICLAALTLGAFIMHWRAVDVWIYPGIGLWAADRLFRIIRLIILNKLYPTFPLTSPPTSNATLHLLTPSTLKITFPNPSHLKWIAGQHFYVILPGMSRLPWEAHPFTAATISGELTFIVRVRDGFTKMMKDKVDEERRSRGLSIEDGDEVGVQVKGVVEGPYGTGRDLSRFTGVLILAGGSGISFAVAHLLQIVQEAREGKTRVTHVKVVWMVKSRLHLNWISPILLANTQNLPPNLNISIDIHVTKHYLRRPSSLSLSTTAGLPEDPASTDGDWQTYMAQRAAAPRRRSRLMSTFSWASWTRRSQNGLSGPGTRRGSEAVLPGETSKLKPAKRLQKGSVAEKPARDGSQRDLEVGDVEKDVIVLPTFTWSEGYGEGFPTGDTDFGPLSGKQRLNSNVPVIIETLDEKAGNEEEKDEFTVDEKDDEGDHEDVRGEEGLDAERRDSIASSLSSNPNSGPWIAQRGSTSVQDHPRMSIDHFDNTSPFSAVRGRQSLLVQLNDVSPRRNTSLNGRPFGDPALLGPATDRQSLSIPPRLNSAPRRRSSIAFDEPPSRSSMEGPLSPLRQSLSVPVQLNGVSHGRRSNTFDEPPSRSSLDSPISPTRQSLSIPTALASTSRRKSITFDELSARSSLDSVRDVYNASPISPTSRRQSMSIPSHLNPSPRRPSSIKIDEPIHPRRQSTPLQDSPTTSRKDSAVPQAPSDPSPTSSRNHSIVTPQPIRMLNTRNLSIQLQTPNEARSSSFLQPSLLSPTYPFRSASPISPMFHPDPQTSSSPLAPPTTPLAEPPTHAATSHEMMKSNSDTSILSIPHLASGALTPAVSDLNEITSSLIAGHAPAQDFTATVDLRRRQSIGLEGIIHWREGRANLKEVIQGMMVDVGVEKGGWVDVSACGPRSLLDTAKGVVKGLSDVRATWRTGGGVRYSAETFGW